MKKILKSRQRILGMRETQLRIAKGESAAARGSETNLEQRRDQLKALSVHMHKAGNDCREGRSLHAQLELVERLQRAGDQMETAIGQARQHTARMERQRIAAYQKREMADRLVGRAKTSVEAETDRKLSEQPRALPRRVMERSA
ncbi:hypothetical protein [Novosphingopyxis iocasae]|uniref:hypothetical protein n=1 Tax=Novosphingopyxis iocasae TaxID=2762729 RepID=UPI001650E392|nr:hypothetical protein [Novosphingopyxis iocasae]